MVKKYRGGGGRRESKKQILHNLKIGLQDILNQ